MPTDEAARYKTPASAMHQRAKAQKRLCGLDFKSAKKTIARFPAR